MDSTNSPANLLIPSDIVVIINLSALTEDELTFAFGIDKITEDLRKLNGIWKLHLVSRAQSPFAHSRAYFGKDGDRECVLSEFCANYLLKKGAITLPKPS